MLNKLFDKILEDDENDVDAGISDRMPAPKKKEKKPLKINWLEVGIAAALFGLAFGVRLCFLLKNDPQNPGYGWYGDVYHHWQIAYLSKTIGFKTDFLRLWDLKGLEFFWGLLHPLVLIILFGITGSIDIIIPRLLAIFGGSLVIVFWYFLLKKCFGRLAGIMGALWATFMAVAWFSDTLGMQEQLGLPLLLGGILAWPSLGSVSYTHLTLPTN